MRDFFTDIDKGKASVLKGRPACSPTPPGPPAAGLSTPLLLLWFQGQVVMKSWPCDVCSSGGRAVWASR
ncbi:hypothetical protein NQZ68_010307 [Dissostichus eleginoides]|nr:hypothetical protein NQZ68_010307 [Dissostichus eleginoides]